MTLHLPTSPLPSLTLLLCSLLSACGGSSSKTVGGGAGGGAGGGGGALAFQGPTSATPTSQTAIVVDWLLATLNGNASNAVIYDVFRSTDAALSDEVLVSSQAGGSSSFHDTLLATGTTYFYRVMAKAEDGQSTDAGALASSHLPTIPPAALDYVTDVEPLWSLLGNDGLTTCLDCHDGTNAVMDLRAWEGLMVGVGTQAAPDSFVIPGEPGKSFQRAISRIVGDPLVRAMHKNWNTQGGIYEAGLNPWIEQGATAVADSTVPVFAPADLASSALYNVARVDAAQVAVTFPHASDPESEPYDPNGLDHLRYHIYGGSGSNSIDWATTVAVVTRNSFATTDPSFTVQFAWSGGGVFVVRAADHNLNEGLNELELELAN